MSNFTANPDTALPSANMPTYPPPSHNTAPTHVEVAPQQASTSPGDGKEVREHKPLPDTPGTAQHSENVPFKERVVGVAQKTRGTVFGDSDLKQHGQAILDGRTTYEEDRHHNT